VLTLSIPFVATRVGKEDEDYSIKAGFVNEKYNMSAIVHRKEMVDLPTYPYLVLYRLRDCPHVIQG
jgi:hypothetical protein